MTGRRIRRWAEGDVDGLELHLLVVIHLGFVHFLCNSSGVGAAASCLYVAMICASAPILAFSKNCL